MKHLLSLVLLIGAAVHGQGQGSFPFEIVLEPLEMPSVPGLQSYVKAEYQGDWLIIGGRTDGLHQRQPWQAFDADGHHLNALLINPDSASMLWAPLSDLNNDILEAQLSATNANFSQVGDYLYIVGGYGLSGSSVHISHPLLTVVNLPAVVAGIRSNGTLDSAAFVSFTDEDFAVAGAKLMHLDSTFWLVGGHRFDGQYNPMGHDTYTQTYTEAIRPFKVSGEFPALGLTKLAPIIDTDELHRRDYNVTYMTDGSEYFYTVWSGVFQKTVDLPYLGAVEVHGNSLVSVPDFSQYLNHYHCPTLSLYEENQGAMYTVFFGGIAQYYYSGATLIQDDNVPFVNTIGVVEKRDGGYFESRSSTAMPEFVGAGAEFFLYPDLAQNHHILTADSIGSDTTWVGHIYGGISSPAANVFFAGMTNPSTASSTIYKVGLLRTEPAGLTEDLPAASLQLQVAPNPSRDELLIQFNAPSGGRAEFAVITLDGRVVLSEAQIVQKGMNNLNLGDLMVAEGNYILRMEIEGRSQQLRFSWH